jgi:DNA-binding response OmpR family regulator
MKNTLIDAELQPRAAEDGLCGYRLLVVEDDYFVAQELCNRLRECGAEVLGPAPDIATALELARRLRPDCVLLDINLDGEAGFQLARELQMQRLRTVFTTGYDRGIIPPELRHADYLQKPFDSVALMRSIRAQPPARPA